MIVECTGSGGVSASCGKDAEAEEARASDLHEVVLRARDGDLVAQSELVRRYSRRVSGFLHGILRDRIAVEDLTQITWIKVVQRLPSLRDPATFESWLFTTARNAALDYMRRMQCRPASGCDENALINLPAERGGEGDFDLLEVVEKKTRSWTQTNRRILHDLVIGTSYQDMAARERLSLGALKLRVHRIRRLLRAELGAMLAEIRSVRA
ncbi:MAG: sigma-70 family RNA polymerase sigma factor [Opitutaceae bacterium]|nr:sigma-70 family RNA polymerase sigma factor [Opitutaceae bacterium]